MKRSIFIILLLSIFISCLIAERSYAVPSFARQTGKSCSGCHTVWPRLNITGREFKVTAYTDVAEDYQRIEKDTLDLLRYGPLSLSIITLPYTKTTGQRAETNIPDEVALFYAGRITPEIGAFIEPILAPEFEFEFAKIAWYSRLGEHTIGIVGGKMDTGGADPYNTIRFTAYHTINMPAILERQDTISERRTFFPSHQQRIRALSLMEDSSRPFMVLLVPSGVMRIMTPGTSLLGLPEKPLLELRRI
jgi:hypothetical protein